jgi:hypothetical protein
VNSDQGLFADAAPSALIAHTRQRPGWSPQKSKVKDGCFRACTLYADLLSAHQVFATQQPKQSISMPY